MTTLVSSRKIRVWCELCGTDVWIRFKSVEDMYHETMYHKKGYCQTHKKGSFKEDK